MTWTINYNSTLHVIEVILQDRISGPDVHEITSQVIAMQQHRKILQVLVDASQVESPPPIVDIYELPARQYIEEGLNRLSRIALVEPKSLKALEAAHFYVTACVNMGWQVKSFPVYSEALDWLKGTVTYTSETG